MVVVWGLLIQVTHADEIRKCILEHGFKASKGQLEVELYEFFGIQRLDKYADVIPPSS